MSGPAFADRPAWELGRILHCVANTIVHKMDWPDVDSVPLTDDDGNVVGSLDVEREPEQLADAFVIDAADGVLSCVFRGKILAVRTGLAPSETDSLVGSTIKIRFRGFTAGRNPIAPRYI